jgi:MFS family permease
MLTVLRQRNFALLWLGQLISLMGDWTLLLTLPFYVFQMTGSTLASGAMFVVQVFPRVVFGSLAGVFVDRWNRKWTMIVADLSRAALLLVLLVVQSGSLLWVVYVVGVVQTMITLFFSPARNALVPDIVDEDHLIAANSLDGISDNLTRLIGPPLGGALLSLFGALAPVAIIDSVSYLFSGLLIMLVIVPAVSPTRTPDLPAAKRPSLRASCIAVWSQWVDGLRLVKREPVIRGIFVVVGLAFLADAPLTALIVPLVKNVYHGDAFLLGLLMTFRGGGGLVGGFLTGLFSKRVYTPYLMAVGFFLSGVTLLVIINIPSVPLAAALLVVTGIVVMLWIIGSQTLLQSTIADAYRGRVFGTYDTTIAALSVIGLTLGSMLGNTVGILPVLNGANALYLLAGALTLVLLGRAVITSPTQAPSTVKVEEEARTLP